MPTISTMRLITAAGAAITTVALFMSYGLEAAANIPLVPQHVDTLIRISVVVWWFGFIASYCRDTVSRRIDARAADVLVAIECAVEEAGDRRATTARIDTLRQFQASDMNGRRPHLVES